MSSVITGIAASIAFGAVIVAVFQFFNVTLWQCRQFGNCPWYLDPIWGQESEPSGQQSAQQLIEDYREAREK